MSKGLGELENLLGYQFKDVSLLGRAVIHRSWAYEQAAAEDDPGSVKTQNETLEFVGDSVLGLAIAEQLYRKHPDLNEGDLTLMKHHLVSAPTLAMIAKNLGLGRFIRLGKGEEKTGGREKHALLADTLEAIIGAVFFDGGYIPARATVSRLFAERLKRVTPMSSLDYKTLLQETLQADKKNAPNYEVIRTKGPSHSRTFWVEAVWDTGSSEGSGVSIKAAEMEAARLALEQIKSETGKQS